MQLSEDLVLLLKVFLVGLADKKPILKNLDAPGFASNGICGLKTERAQTMSNITKDVSRLKFTYLRKDLLRAPGKLSTRRARYLPQKQH